MEINPEGGNSNKLTIFQKFVEDLKNKATEEKLELNLAFHKIYQPDEINSHEFLKYAQNTEMPELYRLELRYIDELICNDIEDANRFFKNCFPIAVKYLFLSGGDWCDISAFHPGLQSLLSKVRSQIYLLQFKIEPASLSLIIESSCKVKELTFCFCEFGDISLESFVLNPELTYEIKNLNMFKSCQEKDTRFLNDEKLDVIIEQMSKTSLKDSLRHFALDEQDYEADEKLEIFEKFGFKLGVYLDDDLPSPGNARTHKEYLESLES
ncbi:unnamed protein product [Moneuplotes crassus]|uniref:Uncharacterized protein n=1 Tax=Euplotes crassus TaxID=5936 RepID=A0AAD2D3V7_EUPCR|nr:unnamed protein product [Moneuplotes crassus]